MRNISFALTIQQIRARTKTVTRRVGWRNLRVGERLQACEKCMGRKSGEPLVRLCVIEVVDVRFEKLRMMTGDVSYGLIECAREGFGEDARLRFPSEFVSFFCASHAGCTPETEITRIQFRYIE